TGFGSAASSPSLPWRSAQPSLFQRWRSSQSTPKTAPSRWLTADHGATGCTTASSFAERFSCWLLACCFSARALLPRAIPLLDPGAEPEDSKECEHKEHGESAGSDYREVAKRNHDRRQEVGQ